MWEWVGLQRCANIQGSLTDIRWPHLWLGSLSCGHSQEDRMLLNNECYWTDSSSWGKVGRNQGSGLMPLLTGLWGVVAGEFHVKTADFRSQIPSTDSHGVVSPFQKSQATFPHVFNHRGSRPRLYPEGRSQLRSGLICEPANCSYWRTLWVLMWTELVNGLSLIKKINTGGWESSGSAFPQLLTSN